MRSRNIKPGLFRNELLGAADPLLTLLFQGLWCIADREGRLEDRPLRIKAEVFPYRDVPDIHGYLTQLEKMGFIFRYRVKEAGLIQVVNFKKHQSPHHTEKKSQLPAPVNSPLEHGENPPDSLIPDLLIHRFSDSPIQSQNTKASASPTHSQNNPQPNAESKSTPESNAKPPDKEKPGRPLLTTEQVAWVQGLTKHLGFPDMDSRDYALAVQFAEKSGWDMDAFQRVLDLREAGGIESFTRVGDVFSAAIGYQQHVLREKTH
jgi:hypothetical protein